MMLRPLRRSGDFKAIAAATIPMSRQLDRLCRPRLDHSLARAVALFGLESSDAVETDSLGKTLDAAELVDGAVGIDGEHTNGTGAGQYVE